MKKIATTPLNERVWKRYTRPCESIDDVFWRVAEYVAENGESIALDVTHACATPGTLWSEVYYDLMASGRFLPNSPTLMNAGKEEGENQLAACFVLPVDDDMKAIMKALTHQVLIHKSGGGTGFNFSRLRPKGSRVGSTNGVASGPVSFMSLFDKATSVVQQGGMRRGANMGILEWRHPDALAFVNAKADGTLENFNISLAVDGEFFRRLDAGDEKVTEIWLTVVSNAWESGDPGLVFLDRINANNPTPHLGPLESTNPCGESPLRPYEACNLGSINLSAFVDEDGTFAWGRLRPTVVAAVHFLNDVITACDYPLEEIRWNVDQTRKIGLGVMGWADCLALMGIPYNSDEAVAFAEMLAREIQSVAHLASENLARLLGPYPAYDGNAVDYPPRRNATVTCIAPTGSISILAGCSSGIEPHFARSYARRVVERDGDVMVDVEVPVLATVRERYPGRDISTLVPTALEVAPEWHVRHQAAWQKGVDLAVSKTVNLPHSATVTDVMKVYRMAYDLGCMGITVYRDGSKSVQVLTNKEAKKAPVLVSTPRKAERPDELTGRTRKVPTVFGNLYVTCNEMDGVPFEVFATLGKGGKEVSAATEALGRLISLALRHGVPLEEVVGQLKGIAGEQPVFDEDGSIKSLPDAIGKALERLVGKTVTVHGASLCPECGAVLLHEEGCLKCTCGFSKC